MSSFQILTVCIELVACTIALTVILQEKTIRVSATPILPHVRRKAIEMVRNRLDADAPLQIADLGCGWGGLLMALGSQFPRAGLVGYELSFWPLLASRLRAAWAGSRFRVLREDFFAQDLSSYNLLCCYLSPFHMEKLKPQLATLKPGSVVLSSSFPVIGWTPVQQESVRGIFVDIPIFLYIVNQSDKVQ